MANKKPVRTRGKVQLSRYFQDLGQGDYVSICLEKSVQSNIPKRLQGITGIVEGRRGKACIVRIKDGNKDKWILAEPIHLKKIKQIKKA